MLNLLFATSEAVPFAKTGGLADVCGALPIQLRQLGHAVTVIMPAYRCIRDSGIPIRKLDLEFEVPVGNRAVAGGLLAAELPDSDVPVYFVEQDDYFDRDHLYGEGGVDYRDNCERFVFFSRAALEAIRILQLQVDIVHCHDWQTGLVPVYLNAEYRVAHPYERVASVMTIHNMAYQGRFWHWDMLLTGLDWKYFNWKQLEFHGDLNLLKAGIVFADSITTVSPRYAEEIQTADYGCGLASVLAQRHDDLRGILNGVDYAQWNPSTDPHLEATYDVTDWKSGKAACKSAVQEELGLPKASETPLIGVVGRLAEQKGLDLILDIMHRWSDHENVQWAVLGTGEREYEKRLERLAAAFPQRVAVRLEFSNRMAHRIEAGSDLFLMPSRFEPCGLNQFYSLIYGSVPVVHATGGLADTICNADAQSIADKTANGFSFDTYNVDQCEIALRKAIDTYHTDRTTWDQLVQTGMSQDWSWRASAEKYSQMYHDAISRLKTTVSA